MGSGGPTAGWRLAQLDYDATDTPSVDAIGAVGFRWPEPGQFCLDLLTTLQLYWPHTELPYFGTGGECEPDDVVRVDGNALCPDCRLPYYQHDLAPYPLDLQRERFVYRLCDGKLGKT